VTTRPRRRRLTDKQVKALPSRATRYAEPDPELVGHYVRVAPSGAKSFVAVARDPYGKQIWTTIGVADVLVIEEARERAREIVRRVKAGKAAVEPLPVKPDSFRAVAENWIKRHVIAKRLRTRDEIERCLRKYIYPHWEDRPFIGIQRSDVARLLDHVEDQHGVRQADYVLAIVRKMMNWFATRDDKYASPVIRGMGRASQKNRDRKLNDDEIRIIWRQAEQNGRFGAIIRLALLTAQRREKIAAMRWCDISADGVWNIPTEEREKGVGGSLILPEMAVEIVRGQSQIEGNPHVFPGRGLGHFNGFSPCKRMFDKKLPPMKGWTIHDLRRTARSLMSRAGVSSDHAERVLGHMIKGIEGVYDRHTYIQEKADALRKLAALIEEIISGDHRQDRTPADAAMIVSRRDAPHEITHKKRQSLISLSDVEEVFNDQVVKNLARPLKLPSDVDITRFCESIRIGARIFLEAKAKLNDPQLRAAIARLYQLNTHAERGGDREARALARAVAAMPADVSQWLISRNPDARTLPTAAEILAPATRQDAVDRFRLILSYGGGWVGRKRPGGRRSWSFKPWLRAPETIQPGRPGALAEREFVQWLAVAYVEATGRSPPRTAHFESSIRGPFPNFVHQCFELIGAPTGNVTRLLNEYGELRRRAKIVMALKQTGPMKIGALIEATSIRRKSLNLLLGRMAKEGEIQHMADGSYAHKDFVPSPNDPLGRCDKGDQS
jgi:integrase